MLFFRVQSQVTYKDKTSNVFVSGDIFVRDQLKWFVKVGLVDFQQDDCQGNPVVAYLLRHGNPQGSLTPLANDAYTLSKDGSTVFITPLANEPYSKISGDFNPIHNQSLFLRLRIPPWHNHTRYVVERRYSEVRRECCCQRSSRSSSCVSSFESFLWPLSHCFSRRYDVIFVGMVLPGDELKVNIHHVSMRDGNIVVKIETTCLLYHIKTNMQCKVSC